MDGSSASISEVVMNLEYLMDALTDNSLYDLDLMKIIENIVKEFSKIVLFFIEEDLEVVERDKRWVEDLRDMAVATEDTINSLRVIKERQRKMGFFKKCFNYFIARAKVPEKSEGIKYLLDSFSNDVRKIQRRLRESSPHIDDERDLEVKRLQHRRRRRRRTYSSIIDDDEANNINLVGMEEKIKAIEEEILTESSRVGIIVIMGMEGTGKTCLAKTIYNSDSIAIHFGFRRAWVDGSQLSSHEELLQEVNKHIITHFWEAEEIVSRRSLLVIDDVDNINWSNVQAARTTISHFLRNKPFGSRIVITTRGNGMLEEDDVSRHHVGLLSDAHSWELFTMMKIHIPQSLEQVGKKLVKTYGGLPISIIQLRNTLLSICKESEECSKVMLESAHRQQQLLINEEQSSSPWSDTLAFIDTYLPLHLKRCLLYLGFFPEWFDIPVRRLIPLWVAEGLMPVEDSEPSEKVALKYLKKLIDWNMIQVAKQRFDGTAKTCRLPPALREHCLSKARESKYHSQFTTRHADSGKIRDDSNLYAQRNELPSLDPYKFLQSFWSFDFQEGSGASIVELLVRGITRRYFLSLRVLDLERVYKPKLPNALGKLVHLRYLGLRWTYLDALPSSIGNLFNLQTLDVKHTYITTFPDSIWKMKQLRHLFLNESYHGKLAHRPSTGSSGRLQTLWGIYVDEECLVKDGLDRLTNITRLGLTFNLRRQAEAMAKWIEKLEHLQSLRLRSKDEQGGPSQLRLKSLHHQDSLSDLYLFGCLEKLLGVDEFPPFLTNLTLSASGLKEDPMPVLGRLSSLRVLKLFAGSFVGKSMVCCSEGFPKLQSLKIWKLEQLEEWKVDERAMQVLKELEIRSCENLKMLPIGLQQVTTLRELTLTNMPTQFTAKDKVDEMKKRYKKAKVHFVDWNQNSNVEASSSNVEASSSSPSPNSSIAVNNPVDIIANINSIPMLNDTNFKSWQEYLLIVLGVMDLDLALRVGSPTPLTDKSTSDEKRDVERWEKSNRMCMMIMKKAIPEAFRGTMSDKITMAKEFLVDIEKRFVKNEKVEIGTLLISLISMRYKGEGNIREYIIEMSHLASKLKALRLELSKDLLVHLVLISLPAQFSQFKVSYNCQKETWSLNELISHCVQEEERLKQDKAESAHLASTSKDKDEK